jgi:hypothetical protein
MLYRLKNAETSRKYSIASDINPEFVSQLHSYIPGLTTDKKTGSITKQYWRQIRKQDHSFVCAAQSLLMALIHGQYSAPDIT